MNRYVGVKGVAAWCGVTQAAVSQWIIRFPGMYPEPDATIGELDCTDDHGVTAPERKHADMGWLPERKYEWLSFALAPFDRGLDG